MTPLNMKNNSTLIRFWVTAIQEYCIGMHRFLCIIQRLSHKKNNNDNTKTIKVYQATCIYKYNNNNTLSKMIVYRITWYFCQSLRVQSIFCLLNNVLHFLQFNLKKSEFIIVLHMFCFVKNITHCVSTQK